MAEGENLGFRQDGDGNVHFNVGAPPGMAAESLLALQPKIAEAVYDAVDELDGSISAEHGVGVLKAHDLVRRRSSAELDLMRAVKHAVDPGNLMNPRVRFWAEDEDGASARAAE